MMTLAKTTPHGAHAPHDSLRAELRRRVRRPQRHRLLHGYPMAPLLRPWADERMPHESIALDAARPLLVGVLPHTFCNPTVRGCGFCTFPHEKYENDAARSVVARVASEVRATFPEARARRVDALYIGGGTANLTPPDALRALGEALGATFDLAGAEVTLEGAPRYFAMRGEAMLDALSEIRARHRRISMGIQTFDPSWLARMGRTAFGTPDDFAAVLEAAHARAMTVSCDLLYNLPGQTLAGCLADVARACDLGFDQICVYNLVLSGGMDTDWSRDRSLVARVPDRETACAHWLAVRRHLLDAGYVQTTLTNFERRAVAASERRFVYEAFSFDPATYDALGFGPGAISTFTDATQRTALKWMNEPTSDAYVRRWDGAERAAATAFRYSPLDLRLLHVTRQLARLSIDRAAYASFFGTDVVADFARHFELLEDARLVTVSDARVTLTPEGMFYADAVAGLLAAHRASQLRDGNDTLVHAMG
jgi:oxygen-independent coproporphyrinogen-3 oxidase